jgi:hypothetical protein
MFFCLVAQQLLPWLYKTAQQVGRGSGSGGGGGGVGGWQHGEEADACALGGEEREREEFIDNQQVTDGR